MGRFRDGIRFVRAHFASLPEFEDVRVVPIEVDGKRPQGKDWPNQAPHALNDEELAKAESLYGEDSNAGLVVPPGIVVFDVDPRNGGSELLAKLTQEGKLLPTTLTNDTAGGGYHFFLACDPNIRFPKNPWGPGIDLITSVRTGAKLTGRQVLVPGSVVKGVPYTVRTPAAIADAPSWVCDAGERYKGKTRRIPLSLVPTDDRAVTGEQQQDLVDLVLPSFDKGRRHEIALGLAGLLATAGWDAESTRACVRALAMAAGDTQLGDRLLAVHMTYQRLDNGEDVAGFSKLKELVGEELAKRLDALAWAAGAPQTGEGDVKPVLSASSFAAYSCEDLAQWEPPQVEYLVEGMLPRGQLTLFAGPPKGGKTTYMTDLVGCMVKGDEFCGRGTTLKEDECILWATEEPKELFLERIVNERDWSPEMLARTLVTFRMAAPSHYRWKDFMPQLAKAVNELAAQGGRKVALLILDTFQDWSDLDDNDENHTGAVKRELRYIRNFMQETGCAVMILHHTRKAEGGFISDKIRGASALAGMTDGLIILDGVSNTRTTRKVVARGRTAAMRWEQRVRLTEDGYVAEEAPEASLKERERIILDTLSQKARTAKSLADATGRAARTVERALASLKDRRLVKSEGKKELTWSVTDRGREVMTSRKANKRDGGNV